MTDVILTQEFSSEVMCKLLVSVPKCSLCKRSCRLSQ